MVVDLPRALPAQALAWPAAEHIVGLPDLLVADAIEASALREEVAQQPVGVLVRAPLPRVVRQAEVDGGADGLLGEEASENSLPPSRVTLRTTSCANARSITSSTSPCALRAALPPTR